MKTNNTVLTGLAIIMMMVTACSQPETTQAVRKDIQDGVFASGHIEQAHNYTVSAKVEGILTSAPVKEGDTVKQHALIAVIESDVQANQLQDAVVVYQDAVSNADPASPQLQSLQSQIDQATQQLAFDQENFQRYQALWEKKSVSKLDFEKASLQFQASQANLQALEQNYQEMQNALRLNVERSQVQVSTQQAKLKDHQLVTGTSGQVISVYKKEGELVRKGEAIAKIGSGPYIIKLLVSEDDITKLDPGQSVAVNLNTYPHDVFQARVTRVYPGFDEAEQSYTVEAEFVQQPAKMFSGTQLTANIETGGRQDMLVIPTAYVSKGNTVLLKDGTEKQIVTGSNNKEWTEVISGISESDVLIKPTP